jgi:4-amino-4-deoxy-L-arabinose transferase-like glycosyltransferase/predicted dehydrogenase
MQTKVSVALVGAGYWGKKLLPKFVESAESLVKAVCDIHPAHRAEINQTYPDIPTTTSFDDILSDPDIAAVILATPLATHFSLARKAIEAGKHIWIEKPLALRVQEGRELVGLSQSRGTALFVDHTFLYDPAIRKIRDLIAHGELGHVHHIYSQRLNLGRIKRDSNVWWNSAPHDVSILLYLLESSPRSIALHGYRYLQSNLEDLNMAVLEMSDGASAFVYHNWLFPENTARLTAIGSKRMLVYEGKFEKRAVTLYDYVVGEHSKEVDLQHPPTTIPSKMIAERTLSGLTAEEPLALAVDDFLASIRQGHPPVSDGAFSLRVLEVLEAGEKSLRSGGAKISVRPEPHLKAPRPSKVASIAASLSMNETIAKRADAGETVARYGLRDRVLFGVLLLLCGVVLFGHLGASALFEPDEGRNAEKAREILLLNDWVTPYQNFTVVLDKPIAYYWLVAASYKMFGVSEWAARLPSALAAAACVLLVFLFGRRFFGFWEALWSALVLLTSLEFYLFARLVIFDMVLTLCISLSLVCFFWALHEDNTRLIKLLLFCVYSALGAGTLIKGPIGFLLPSMVILPYLIVTRQFSALRRLALPLGIVFFLLIVLPWYYEVGIRNPGYWRYFLWEENFLRYLTPHFKRGQKWFYFFMVAAIGFLPWTVCIPAAIRKSWRERKDEKILWLILWTIVPFTFFSFSSAKLPHYILPIFPPLALLTGIALVRQIDTAPVKRSRLLGLVCLLVFLIVLFFEFGASWPQFLPHPARETMATISPWVRTFGWMTSFVLLGLTILLWRLHWTAQTAYLSFVLGFIAYLHFAGYFMEVGSINRSTRELVTRASPFLEPQAQIVLYDTSYESLPFYLKIDRPIWIVSSGKKTSIMGSFYLAEQGARYAPGFDKSLLTFAEFSAEWAMAPKGHLLVFIKQKNLTRLEQEVGSPAETLVAHNDLLLVTN